MFKWVADLHVHTLLSPCAAIEMTPRHIVMRAAQNGVNLVAITDHNVSANVSAALIAGQEYNVAVWPGVEVETLEGGHVVVLFDSLGKTAALQKFLDKHMSGLKNDSDKFGAQFIVDDQDDLIKEEERLLLTAVRVNLHALTARVKELGGICIAAHVDRPAYSMLNYLGFLSADDGLVAVELSKAATGKKQEKLYLDRCGGLPYITSSDAHQMEDFLAGGKTHIYMAEPTIKEFALALAGLRGRGVDPGKFLPDTAL